MTIEVIDKLFLERWQRLNFESWNETDVREEFLAPLLTIFGYSKGTINDIIREKSLNLTEPYHRIGRKRVSIDYVPTIRLKNFWIIEAKPGNPKDMNYGDLLQAHLYAIHPEVKANFIMLSNGWEIRVYDSLTLSKWEEPILICTQGNCFETFPDLKKIVGAKELLNFQRKRILEIVKDSFAVEIDENNVKSFRTDVEKLVNESLIIVSKNAQQLKLSSWKEAEDKELEELKKLDVSLLFIRMDIPIFRRIITGSEFLRRVLLADSTDRNVLVDLLARKFRGRPHAIFRVLATYILVNLLKDGIEIDSSPHVRSIKSLLEELVKANITYWESNSISNALCHLDNTTLRLAKKYGIRLGMEALSALVEEKKRVLSIEDLIVQKPSVSGYMVGLIGLLGESFWRCFCNSSKSDDIWQGIWHLQLLEGIIESMPLPKYPKGDSDLLFFESYGRGYDMLCVGTWDVLQPYVNILIDKDVAGEIIDFAQLSWEQVVQSIPKEIDKPEDWTPNQDFLAKILNQYNLGY